MGRLNRKPFWIVWLPLALVAQALAEIMKEVNPDPPILLLFVAAIIVLAWMLLTLSVKRLHDVNMQGYWILLNVIPIIGTFVLLVIWAIKGTSGPNRFGADPLEQMQEAQATSAA